MKFLIAFVALVALAAASPLSKSMYSDLHELEAIIAAINSPSTDPATAALLVEQLMDIISAVNPVEVGPVIVPAPEVVPVQPEPVAIGPVLVPGPVDGGAVTAPVAPSPVVIGPIPEGAPAPLVQIIVNIKQASGDSVPVGPVVQPEPVGVVEVPVDPVNVVEVAPVPVVVDPVQVVETAPVAIEPVIIGTPIIPEPAVILPEELN